MMVMPYDEERLLVVLQVDHSRVTGLFAAHWGNAEFAAPETILSEGDEVAFLPPMSGG